MESTSYIFFAIIMIKLTISTDSQGVGVAVDEDLCKGKSCSLTGEWQMSMFGKCICKKREKNPITMKSYVVQRYLQGYKFDDETNTKCVDMDECGSHFHDPCGHRGVCQNFIGSYSCSCLQCWNNDPLCNPNVSSDTRCVPGYGGSRCQDSMCGHYGYSQTVGVDDYRCICSDGWTHTSEKGICVIDVDECEQPDVCSNKGLCHNTQGSYACVCLSSWDGANCSAYNCTVRACKNGGTCVDGRCLCTKEWTDNDCSSNVPIDIDSLIPGIPDRMLLYGSCGILIILIILLLVSVWCAFKNKKQRTISPLRTLSTEIANNGQFQRKRYSNKPSSVNGGLPFV